MTSMVSGGFDPLHVGHLKLLRHATAYGLVVVALNSDEWLVRKKGYIFMPWEERRDILLAIEDVYRVYKVVDTDDTVAEALRKVNPDFFCNGGDRKEANEREQDVCEDLKITQIFGAGGNKIQSSQGLVWNVVSEVSPIFEGDVM